MIAAQQPSSSSATTHYTSSRLRRDAPDDTLSLINNFQVLTSNLLTAKREEALQLAKKLAEAERQAEASRVALEEKMAEIARKDELIAQYESRTFL